MTDTADTAAGEYGYQAFSLDAALASIAEDPTFALTECRVTRARLREAFGNPQERLRVELCLRKLFLPVTRTWHAMGLLPDAADASRNGNIPREGVPTWALHEVDLDAIKDAPPTEWLWWPYMARGTIVLVDGEPGTGKSLFTMQMAASLSKGFPLPNQQGVPGDPSTPQHVVVFNVEDSPAQTILPRFRRCGGNPQWLHIIDGMQQAAVPTVLEPFTLANVALLDAYLSRLTHPCALVVIDPLQAYFGAKVDMHRANETRAMLTPLRAVAEKHHTVILCVRHPAKGIPGTRAIHRGLGSIDIVGIARSALFVETFPGRDGESKCWLMQTKNNLERIGRTQVFSKEDGLFSWGGVSRLTAEDIAGGTRGPDPVVFLEACAWLEAHLTPMLEPSADIEEQAALDGISKKTLERARKALRVESRKSPQGGWAIRLAPLEILKPYVYGTPTQATETDDTVPF